MEDGGARISGGAGRDDRSGPGWPRPSLRFGIYAAVLLAIALWRFVLAPKPPQNAGGADGPRKQALVIAGLDLAPGLIPKLGNDYAAIRSETDLRYLPGGTRQALQDVINRRAQVAFLNRPPTAEERGVLRAVKDSLDVIPVALGGIALITSSATPRDSISLDDLRGWIGGGSDQRLYALDPNLGLWSALMEQLGLPDRIPESVVWLASVSDLCQAMVNDPGSLGVVSTFVLPDDLSRAGLALVPVSGRGEGAFTTSEQGLARGDYPLLHFLYVSCRPDADARAASFVSYVRGGRGQRRVEHEGFLPARQVAREVLLVSAAKPARAG